MTTRFMHFSHISNHDITQIKAMIIIIFKEIKVIG